jgi:hypothetical protein
MLPRVNNDSAVKHVAENCTNIPAAIDGKN